VSVATLVENFAVATTTVEMEPVAIATVVVGFGTDSVEKEEGAFQKRSADRHARRGIEVEKVDFWTVVETSLGM